MDEQCDFDQIPLDDGGPSTFNYPSLELLHGSRMSEYMKTCIPLYKASIDGDYMAVRDIMRDTHQRVIRLSITRNRDMILHVAATSGSFMLVQYLVGKMSDEDLLLQNGQGYTALSLVAANGEIKIAQLLVGRCPQLLTIRGKESLMPLHIAAMHGRREMVAHLFNLSGWTSQDKRVLFLKCIESDLFDVAQKMLVERRSGNLFELGEDVDYIWRVLRILALKPYAFKDVQPSLIWRNIRIIMEAIFSVEVRPLVKKSEATLLLTVLWKRILKMSRSEILSILRGPKLETETDSLYPSRLPFVALENGNTQFLIELIDEFPDLMWFSNDEGLSLFHVAVLYRNEHIYNIIHETGSRKEVIKHVKDSHGNTMLHLAAMHPRGNLLEAVPGAAFQMQRELLWFKEVEAMVPHDYLSQRNNDGFTAAELFDNNHRSLVSEGGQWMKVTATQCIVVVALIATMVYQSNFAFPGGYDEKGLPILRHSRSFLTFVILNAISFLLAVSAVILFLSIRTTRYAQRDFLRSSPKRLMVAVTFFVFSIISLILAFTINFFLLYRKKTLSIPIIITFIALVGVVPVLLYIKLESSLFLDVVRSTISSRYLFKPRKPSLHP